MSVVAALIVKNEEAVIARCLDSLVPHTAHIIVNDNGSTDNTSQIVDEYDCTLLVPGEWVNFSTNRNLVLRVARKWGDYVLAGIDADEVLVTPEGWTWPELTADAYHIECRYGSLRYKRLALVRSDKPFTWRYPIHEILGCDGSYSVELLPDIYIQVHSDGARAKDPTTQEKDLQMLLQACKENPDEPRFQFYAAQTLKDLRRYNEAITRYGYRMLMEGYWEEKWYAQFMVARCTDWLGGDPLSLYIRAHEVNPTRAEPLYYAGEWCRRHELRQMAAIFGRAAIMLQPEGLFVEGDVYEWRTFDLIASVAWYTKDRSLGRWAVQELIRHQKFPPEHRARIEANAAFYV